MSTNLNQDLAAPLSGPAGSLPAEPAAALRTSKLSEWRFAFSLALVTLMSPCATDMYLASMPDITRHLGVSYASVQLTLTGFLLAQGLGQIFFGPLIDRFGRRRPLLAGLVAFIAASVWAASADSIAVLVVSRFLQGFSGALCWWSVSAAFAMWPTAPARPGSSPFS